MQPSETLPLSDLEKTAISQWRSEVANREAWLKGYVEGGQYIVAVILQARKLEGTWNISPDGTALVKVEG